MKKILISVLESRDCREIFSTFPDFDEWAYENQYLKLRTNIYRNTDIPAPYAGEIEKEVVAGYFQHIRGIVGPAYEPHTVEPQTDLFFIGAECRLFKPSLKINAGVILDETTRSRQYRSVLHIIGPEDKLVDNLQYAIKKVWKPLEEQAIRPWGSLLDLNACLAFFGKEVFDCNEAVKLR